MASPSQTQTINAEWVAEILSAKWSTPIENEFSGVSIDTRTIKQGSLFVGIRGVKDHGQSFIAQATAAGATAAIVEQLQDSPLPQLVVKDSTAALQKLASAWRMNYSGAVIGLSGSSGKTSTKELLAHLLGRETHKTSGNLNNHLGVPLTILHGSYAAPFWVLEAGISAEGEMDLLAKIIQPNAALLTMIGTAHLEFFKRKEATAAEKGKLLHAVKADGLCLLHGSDVVYPALQNLKARTWVLKTADDLLPTLPQNYQILETSYRFENNQWKLKIDKETYTTPLWTPGMVHNAAICIVLARQLKISAETIQKRLQTWAGVNLRGQWVRYNEGPKSQRIYLDAYNCNPEGLIDALWKFEREANENPRLYVLSAMGELGDEGQTLQTQAATHVPLRPQDRVCLVGQNIDAMREGLTQAGLQPAQLTLAPTVEEVKLILKDFDGDCFIKGSHYGSRLFTLEKLCSAI